MTDIEFRSDVEVKLFDYMGDDSSIVNSARVSTIGAAQYEIWVDDNDDKARGLINFLMRDRHGTPFEHNALTFRISAPLFVFYEFHRHRVGWSYNEESARYRELEPVFYVPSPDRALRQIGKPGAYRFEPGNAFQIDETEWHHKLVAETSWGHYKQMLEKGVAREVARNVLPVSVYKTMYATCNLRSLFAFLSLRWAHPLSTVPTFPLAEIQMVAEQLDEKAREIFPLAFDSFDQNGRIAP